MANIEDQDPTWQDIANLTLPVPGWHIGRSDRYIIHRYRIQITRLRNWKREDQIELFAGYVESFKGKEYAESYRERMRKKFAERDQERVSA